MQRWLLALWLSTIVSMPGLLMCGWSLFASQAQRFRALWGVIQPWAARYPLRVLAIGALVLACPLAAAPWVIPSVANRATAPAARRSGGRPSIKAALGFSLFISIVSVPGWLIATLARLALQKLRARRFYFPLWSALVVLFAGWSIKSITELQDMSRNFGGGPGWGAGVEVIVLIVVFVIFSPGLPLFFATLSAYPVRRPIVEAAGESTDSPDLA
jgi:hypothetical protein